MAMLRTRIIRLFKTLLPLPVRGLQYALHRLSGGRLFAAHRYRFSCLLVLPHLLRHHPGMISLNERAFLQWCARHLYTGRGEIVDLGAWFGATTSSLAKGLVENSQPAARARSIHAYDTFAWEPSMDLYSDPVIASRYQPGDSFLPEFASRMAPWGDRIRTYPGDLTKLGWVGGPIELLLVDAMKSWELMHCIVRSFYPALIPGVSLVVHQDFCHFWESWIHLLQYRLREYFEPVYDVPLSGTVAFALRRQIPAELLDHADRMYTFSSFDEDEIDAAFAYSSSLVSADLRPIIAAAKAMLYVHAGERAKAVDIIADYRTAGRPWTAQLAQVEALTARPESGEPPGTP